MEGEEQPKHQAMQELDADVHQSPTQNTNHYLSNPQVMSSLGQMSNSCGLYQTDKVT